MNKVIYLDYAAATPLDKRVFAAMEPFLVDDFYNPSAAYSPARAVKTELNDARHRLAMTIGAKSAEIVMTAGATESINLALQGVMKGSKGNIVVGATEHKAVLATAKQFNCRTAVADKYGLISVESVKAQINDQTRLISITMADSELGTVQPIKQIAQLVKQTRQDRLERGIKTPLLLHSDGAQAAGLLDINVARLGVDLLSLNAAKCYGPKQVGLLYVRAGVDLEPVIFGGGQERGLRSGTENVAGTVGFALSLELAESKRQTTVKHLANLRQVLARTLTELVADLQIDSHPKKHLPGMLHISLAGLDAERVVFALDQCQIYVATGSACAANKQTRSTVLDAIGMEESQADGSLRISLGRSSTLAEVEIAAKMIAEVINKERNL